MGVYGSPIITSIFRKRKQKEEKWVPLAKIFLTAFVNFCVARATV